MNVETVSLKPGKILACLFSKASISVVYDRHHNITANAGEATNEGGERTEGRLLP